MSRTLQKKMKILIVMDPGILVPPKGYGGHERLVYLFAQEYCKMGHDVHLLVTEGSDVEGCTMHPFGKEGFPQNAQQVRSAVWHAWIFLWKRRHEFDLIHNFGRLLYLLPVLDCPVKKIMTYGREIYAANVNKSVTLPNKNIVFTGCSNNLIQRSAVKGKWKTIYNAIDFSKYELTPVYNENAPLMFLGRIEKVKGCHTAIQIAKQTNNKLIIAGNISPLADEQLYFKNEIEPHIDGKQIIHIGQVNDEQKNYHLQRAKALLFPIEWDEPFGIVMIEAMACGTPVLAFNRGSVNEVIEENITGIKVNTVNELKQAIGKLASIDRTTCRQHALERFNAPAIANQYLSLFNEGKRKIVIITTGQPAANPRVVKEYETLVASGYNTKVLYTYSAEWSHKIDEEKFNAGVLDRKDFILAGGSPHHNKAAYMLSRIIFRIFRVFVNVIPDGFIKNMAVVRSSLALWLAASKQKADLYVAHYVGALPAAAHAAKKNNAPFAFDAEDYHRGEPVYYKNQKGHIVSVEDKYLPSASFISAASPLIAEAYKKNYAGCKVVTLNNVFSRRFIQTPKKTEGNLTLFWFSQNIGPNRGLEIIIEAMNLIEENISLYLLGNNKNTYYFDELIKKSRRPDLVHLIPPVIPEKVFSIAARFDIGLASELPLSENRDLCLTNKIFTYLLAGNCVLASDTSAQKAFMETYPNIGLLYKSGNAFDLALQIKTLINNKVLLDGFKKNALTVSNQVLDWEVEEKKLLNAVESVI